MKLNDAYVYRKIYGAALLVPVTKNAKTRNLISLNQTAVKLIEICGECKTPAELADKVLEGYIDAEKYRKNLTAYIENLIENGIICEG